MNCETDFVARNNDFQSFCKSLAKAALDAKVTNIDELKQLEFAQSNVEKTLAGMIATIGENMTLRRMKYFDLSESGNRGFISAYNHMGGKIISLVCLKGEVSVTIVILVLI